MPLRKSSAAGAALSAALPSASCTSALGPMRRVSHGARRPAPPHCWATTGNGAAAARRARVGALETRSEGAWAPAVPAASAAASLASLAASEAPAGAQGVRCGAYNGVIAFLRHTVRRAHGARQALPNRRKGAAKRAQRHGARRRRDRRRGCCCRPSAARRTPRCWAAPAAQLPPSRARPPVSPDRAQA